MTTTFDYQLIDSHPYNGRRIRLIPGDLPDSVQGIMIGKFFMALCEDESGQRYYATQAQMHYVGSQKWSAPALVLPDDPVAQR